LRISCLKRSKLPRNALLSLQSSSEPEDSCREREFIDYKTSMITDQDGCCSTRISVSLTHYTFLKKGDGGATCSVFVTNPSEAQSWCVLKQKPRAWLRG